MSIAGLGETLPLFESTLLYVPAIPRRAEPNRVRSLIPPRAPAPGEQYRFHFDMAKCIGCKCCVVACNEQNGNPAAIHWRRVGEVEGGHYPYTQRYHLSMGCNHCLEPSCMTGCPVEAYTKDAGTGLVLLDSDTCIGCQYCTWNCSYGVPQYNPERGVAGKCDMCHHRLNDGMAPACVAACPEEAIAIEIVNIAEWRRDYLEANAPGLPSADDSISTTRITLPADLLPDTGRVDTQRIVPEQPHWPLILMLVLTQLSVGASAVLWLLDRFAPGGAARLSLSALVSMALAGISLAASTLHLGRPVYAWRALRGLRHSWLSREVLALSAFAGVASLYAAMLLFHAPGRPLVGLVTTLCGLAGVLCSARIYLVRARPAWFSPYTIAEFMATVLLLGPWLVRVMNADEAVTWAIVAGGVAQLFTQTLKFLWLSRSDQFELRASALLLSGRLRAWFLLRLALLVTAGVVMPLVATAPAHAAAGLALALAGEGLGRWLFFVSVVPKNAAVAFAAAGREAA